MSQTSDRASGPAGKRVTVRLAPETYGGLIVLKLAEGRSLQLLIEEACALLIATRNGDTP